MKKFIAAIIILATIALIVNFDVVIIFMLSGFVPGINVTLAPSTMIAVFTASTIMLPILGKRQAVYRRCLELYDYIYLLSVFAKKEDPSTASEKPERPRRRYQEL